MNNVVLDANILYSNLLRGLFLWLQWKNLFQISWSNEIWDEVFRNYSKKDERIRDAFRENIQSSVFAEFSTSTKVLKGGFQTIGLPDKDDEHIVALARQEKCSTIVTFNLKDFPQELLSKENISVCSPDLFLCDLLASEPDDVREALSLHIESQTRTKPKKAHYFERLRDAKVPNFASKLEGLSASDDLFDEIW